ncbi:recombinase [Candidatus Saccharibacteria bacterium RAAC3_TM7_1]|nr:recombinase [Candidatus Saccharibacteria bacterium RAAC3_TM7_1]
MEINQQIRYCLYARKSSEQDERQAMSIDSQIKEMSAMAEREGLQVVARKQESFSAKQSAKRPVFNELLEAIRNDEFNGILTWAPDRLSRNAGDLGSLVDLMDSGKLQQIRTFGQSFSNTPNEKFLLMILCSQAKLENDNRGINVKRGIRAKCEMGWRPCMPPLGYFTRAATGKQRDVIIDEERAPHIVKMFEMCAAGKSGRHIKQFLVENDVRTRKDKMIHLSMVYKILKNPFYYGRFEYPAGSSNWYQGKHIPLISKELFEQVQAQLVVPQKSKWGAKEFPYKQFLKCYSCGSSIVGEEKIKQFKNGNRRRYVYYHCSRQVDYDCKEPFASEAAIVTALTKLSNELISDVLKVEPGLAAAIEKFAKMISLTNDAHIKNNVMAAYIRYVLKDGSLFEKTRLVRNLQTGLALHDRKLVSL